MSSPPSVPPGGAGEPSPGRQPMSSPPPDQGGMPQGRIAALIGGIGLLVVAGLAVVIFALGSSNGSDEVRFSEVGPAIDFGDFEDFDNTDFEPEPIPAGAELVLRTDVAVGDCTLDLYFDEYSVSDLEEAFGDNADLFDRAGFEETYSANVLAVLPCDDLHDNEIFAVVDYPDSDTYPRDQVLWRWGSSVCIAAFDDYVGGSYIESDYDFNVLTPSTTDWYGNDDTAAICLVYDLSFGPQVDSLKGSEAD